MTPDETGPHRPRRRLRNLLLDRRFQLKYTGLLVGTAVVLLAILGTIVHATADVAAVQAHGAADLASTAEDQAEHAFRETQASARILRMNQLAQAGADPAVVRAIESELDQVDAHARADVLRVHLQRETVRGQRAAIEQARKQLSVVLLASGGLLVAVLAALGIVITHRVVGPVFHLKRLLHHVGTGRLDIHERLRRHDELTDLFDAFLVMVATMRREQIREIAELDAALTAALHAGAPEHALAELRSLRARMRAVPGLDDGPPGSPP